MRSEIRSGLKHSRLRCHSTVIIFIIILGLSHRNVHCDEKSVNDGLSLSDDEMGESPQSPVQLSKHPVLIVISFDGFRFDYFKRAETPNLNYLRATGASVPYMRNQFVTKTFPNHMSIVTGLHTESHGVIDNELYDPLYNRTLKQDSELYWNFDNRTVPLWTLNELAGDGRKSGVMMWPGSEHPYGPYYSTPSRVVKWNDTISFEWRIDQIMNWITDDKDPVNLVFIYFEEPDEYAHAFGPESDQVTEKIEKLDDATGYLILKLKSRKIFEKVNLVFLSDHGFQQVRQKDMVNISSIVDPDLYTPYGSTPVIQILPKLGKLEEVYKGLKNASEKQNFSVYNKEEIAKMPTWHYANNRRIMPIVLVADLGYVFEDFAKSIEYYDSHFNRTPSLNNFYGVHGYDNRVLPMHPFLITHGPLFKRNFEADPFENIDLFPLICKIMGIEPPPNNGTYANAKVLLQSKGFAVGSPVGWAIGAGIIFGVLILLGIMSILASNRERSGRMFFNPDDTTGYRFINRRGSLDSPDENYNTGEEGQLRVVHPGKEEYQALLLSSSTEDI